MLLANQIWCDQNNIFKTQINCNLSKNQSVKHNPTQSTQEHEPFKNQWNTMQNAINS